MSEQKQQLFTKLDSAIINNNIADMQAIASEINQINCTIFDNYIAVIVGTDISIKINYSDIASFLGLHIFADIDNQQLIVANRDAIKDLLIYEKYLIANVKECEAKGYITIDSYGNIALNKKNNNINGVNYYNHSELRKVFLSNGDVKTVVLGFEPDEAEDLYCCDECLNYYPVDNMIMPEDGNCYCEDCADSVLIKCDYCGKYEYKDEITKVLNKNGYYDNLCRDCVESYAVQCNDCGEYIYERDAHEYDYNYYCDDCIKNYTIHEYHDSHNQIKFIISEERQKLANEAIKNGLYCASQKSLLNKLGFFNNDGFIGFELEVDDGRDRLECARDLNDAINGGEYGKVIFTESDCSLNEGFEIITQPHDYESIQKLDIEKICQIAKDYNFKSHNTDTCGLHVHLSREIFGNEKNANTNIARFCSFFAFFWRDIEKFARRSHNHYCDKIAVDSREYYSGSDRVKSYKVAKTASKECESNRYYAVNCTNYNTVEVRIARGSLNDKTIRATIDFYYNLAIACREMTTADFFAGKEKKYNNINIKGILKRMPASVIKYMKTRGAFVEFLEV